MRRIDARTGDIRTLAGDGKAALPRDGAAANEQPLHNPQSVVIQGANLWVISPTGHTLWRIATSTAAIHLAAGTGQAGYSGDGGPPRDATLDFPKGLAIFRDGDLYVVDSENQVIRAVDPADNTIRTIAGGGPKKRGFAGDGEMAASASLNRPHDAVVGHDGAIYVADTENHRVRRRRPNQP